MPEGYYVVPPAETAIADMRWYAEGRKKEIPEPAPLPCQYAEEFGKGLQTPSGKLEFAPELLIRHAANNPDRPAINRYIPSWEGLRTAEHRERYPPQMIATHSRYSFHTYNDGKNSAVSQVEDHRVLIAGHRFWLLRLHPADAAARGISHRGLVKIFNDRGAVICAADISPLVMQGVVKSYEASAEFQLIEFGGETIEIGGSMNILTADRPQTRGTSSMPPIPVWCGSRNGGTPRRSRPAALRER